MSTIDQQDSVPAAPTADQQAPAPSGGDLGAQSPRLPPRLGARRHPGIWAFHRHILPHVEGPDGMSGMVTALVVTPEPIDVGALLKA